MPELFQLAVLTPLGSLFDEAVESVIAPGSEGYLGILAHHAPLITALQSGKLTVKAPEVEDRFYALSGGFLEVSNNRAVILADALEEPAGIDIARAERAAERARERIRGHAGACDVDRAEAALKRALTRLQLAKETKG